MYLTSGILLALYLAQLVSSILYDIDAHNILDSVIIAVGGLLGLIAVPLLIAIIAKLFARKSFWGAWWKALAFLAVPLCVVAFFGAASRYREAKELAVQAEPIEFKLSAEKLKEYQSNLSSKIVTSLEQINQAIKESPENATNYYNRGVIYSSELKHDMAIKDYSRAIALNPAFAGAYFNSNYFRFPSRHLELDS